MAERKTLALFRTNAKERVDLHAAEMKKEIRSLQDWLIKFEHALDTRPKGEGFPVSWAETMMEKSLGIFYELGKMSGAVLVRGTGEED